MTNPTLEEINNLKADELVKDIFRGWVFIRENYTKEIQKFQFSDQTKIKLTRLAQKMYEKYVDQQCSSQGRVVLDEGVLKEFWSNLIYGNEPYPLFSYPFSILMADSLSPNILHYVFQHRSARHMDFESFIRFFWQDKYNCIAKFSDVDLKLLSELFSGIDTRSSIGFPNVTEIWNSSMNFSESTARVRYRRLLNLDILVRLSVINYAKLGLIPLIKTYSRSEEPSELENLFSTWKSAFSTNNFFQLLLIPEFSSFWTEHTTNDVNILQSREIGINFSLFDGKTWRLDFINRLVDILPNNKYIPSPQWRVVFFSAPRFPFRSSDLQLLTELHYTPERQVKHLGSRAGIHWKYVSNRLKELQNAGVFQSYFRLYNAGLNERYYLLVWSSENQLVAVKQFVHHLPQYYIVRAEECIYALLWLPSEIGSHFLNVCSGLQEKFGLQELYYGPIDPATRAPHPNLPKLWNKEKEIWRSESSDW